MGLRFRIWICKSATYDPIAYNNQPYQMVQASSCLRFRIWICKYVICGPIACSNKPY